MRALVYAVILVVLVPLAAAEPPASPLLPPDHWAVLAADRLEALGLVEGYMPAQKSVPLLAVAGALAEAEERARVERPDLLPLVAGWRARFAEEWPGAFGDRALMGAKAGLGYQAGSAREDRSQAIRDRPDALRLVDAPTTPFLLGEAAARATNHLAASARARWLQGGAVLDSGEVVGALGWLSLTLGRSRPGFGFSEGAGVLLSGNATLDRVELATTRPIRLPWVFARLGTWTADTFVARFGGARWPDHPLIWATSLRWRIHPRFTLGGQRGIIFGGDPWDGFPAWHRALVLLGLDNYRENNMLTVSARWRMPTERALPLTLLVDWGTDDDPQAAVKIPGLVAGVSIPMIGSAPLSAGVEYAFFGRLCCRPESRSAPWYVHGQYQAGWVVDQTPLGDPLGGNGRALRLRASADPFRGRLRISSLAWVQDRFSSNLYAPQAGGRSVGARAGAELRLGPGALELRGGVERGRAGWRTAEAAVQASASF